MSYIEVVEYDGDPEEYDASENPNPGGIVKRHHYTDGEELTAAAKVLMLLDSRRHFDVRQEIY